MGLDPDGWRTTLLCQDDAVPDTVGVEQHSGYWVRWVDEQPCLLPYPRINDGVFCGRVIGHAGSHWPCAMEFLAAFPGQAMSYTPPEP